MKNIKYITSKQLKDHLDSILEKVRRENVEYIVMIDNEPKAKISPLNNNGKKVYAYVHKEKSKELKEFLS